MDKKAPAALAAALGSRVKALKQDGHAEKVDPKADYKGVRKKGDKFEAYSIHTGKVFGTYASKEQAIRRVRQVEAFKHMG